MQLLVPSVRNSSWINLSLLEQTKCTKFLYSTEMSQKVHELQVEKKGLHTLAVESLDDMTLQDTKYYPYEKSFAKDRWDPVLVLQSSGSTGNIPLDDAIIRVEAEMTPKDHRNLLRPTTLRGRSLTTTVIYPRSQAGKSKATPYGISGAMVVVISPPFHLSM